MMFSEGVFPILNFISISDLSYAAIRVHIYSCSYVALNLFFFFIMRCHFVLGPTPSSSICGHNTIASLSY